VENLSDKNFQKLHW